MDIQHSNRFSKAQCVTHHYTTSVAAHSRKTAEYAERICHSLKKRGIKVNEEDVKSACLLHDIGMTDDAVKSSPSWKKAYLHPRKGEQIAREEYCANEVQCNAIRRHMWPICVIPPKHIEGWVVIAADKTTSLWELFHKKEIDPDGKYRQDKPASFWKRKAEAS